jgi:hypothetical protein
MRIPLHLHLADVAGDFDESQKKEVVGKQRADESIVATEHSRPGRKSLYQSGGEV